MAQTQNEKFGISREAAQAALLSAPQNSKFFLTLYFFFNSCSPHLKYRIASMTAKLFSRADIWLILQIAAVSKEPSHFPISEGQLISFFERAADVPLAQDVRALRTQMPASEYVSVSSPDASDVRLTLRGTLHVACKLVDSYDIPANYLKEVTARLLHAIQNDDARCHALLSTFKKATSHYEGDVSYENTTPLHA